MLVTRRMATAAFDIGRFGLAFAISAAIFAIGPSVALAARMGAFLFFFHR